MRNLPVLLCIRLALASGLAHAEVGPCRPDKYGGLTCGEGDGAARVINDTVSPSKRLALAWRSASSPPTEDQTDNNDDLELLVIRLEDGAVLSRRKTDYWDTGEAQVRRTHEIATWSPDSRLMINALDERFKTAVVDLYTFDRDDKTRGAFDLIRIMEPAVRAQHRRRVKDEKRYEFGLDRIEIDNRGLARAEVGLWVPKSDYDRYYEMTLQVTQKGRGFNVKVLYVSPERIRR